MWYKLSTKRKYNYNYPLEDECVCEKTIHISPQELLKWILKPPQAVLEWILKHRDNEKYQLPGFTDGDALLLVDGEVQPTLSEAYRLEAWTMGLFPTESWGKHEVEFFGEPRREMARLNLVDHLLEHREQLPFVVDGCTLCRSNMTWYTYDEDDLDYVYEPIAEFNEENEEESK